MVAALLALTTLFPQQAPQDTLDALHRAQYFVRDYYDDAIPASRNCRGNALRDCLSGDWTCSENGVCGSVRSRERLIERLEELAPQAGAAAWLFRHRVGFAVKTGDLERAREIAGACPGDQWDCMALRGFVAHQLEPGTGIEFFDSAYVMAPVRVRCDWADLYPLIGSEQVDGQGRRGCASELPPGERFWWMADPLWSRPGNERYAEHLSRHMMTLLHEDVLALIDSVENNGMPTTEYLRGRIYKRHDRNIAEGFWSAWRTEVVGSADPAECVPAAADCTPVADVPDGDGTTRTVLNGGYGFTPDKRRLQAPLESGADDWAVEWDDPRGDSDMFRWDERMFTRERWFNLDHQTALFRRDGQLLVLASAAVPELFDNLRDVRPFLATGKVDDLAIESVGARIGEDRVVRGRTLVPVGSYLVSIEVLAAGAVARARHGAPEPPMRDGFGLSDIALVPDGFDGRPADVLDAMLSSARLAGDGRTGIYVEVYGVDDGETVDVRLAAERVNRSFLRRVVDGLGLASGVTGEVTFSDVIRSDAGAPASLSFALDLSTLDAGDNLLTLTVKRADGREAAVTRVIRVSR